MARLEKHEFFDKTSGGIMDDNTRYVDACWQAVIEFNRNDKTRYFNTYDLFMAIAQHGIRDNELFRVVFALVNAREHYNPAANDAELYTPPIFKNTHVSIMFVPQRKMHCMQQFLNMVAVLLERESTPPNIDDGVLRGYIPTRTSVCQECVRRLHGVRDRFPESKDHRIDKCFNLMQALPVSITSHVIGLNLHIPPPNVFIALVLTSILASSVEFAPRYTRRALRVNQLQWDVMLRFTIAISAATRGDDFARVIAHLMFFTDSANIPPFQRRIQTQVDDELYYPQPIIEDGQPPPPPPTPVESNISQRLAMIGYFHGFQQPTPQQASNMAEYKEIVHRTNGVVSPLVTGKYSMAEAREIAFGRGGDSEALSMVCSDQVVWLLDGFVGHIPRAVDDLSLYSFHNIWNQETHKIALTLKDRVTVSGEHASCTPYRHMYIKWQLIYSCEIATITPMETDIDMLVGNYMLNKVIRDIKPSHKITLQRDSTITREYANYHAMRNDATFFCQPFFGVVVSAEAIETSPAKKAPDTHFRTTFAELAFVTLYPNFGVALKSFLEFSVLRNPIKAAATMCFIFLRRLEVTGSLWPDAHDRNFTVRIAPEDANITVEGRTIHIAKGEQMVCAIDHGDNTPSRNSNELAGCDMLRGTIESLLLAHRYNFQIVPPNNINNDNELVVMNNDSILPSNVINRQDMVSISGGFFRLKATINPFMSVEKRHMASNALATEMLKDQDLSWLGFHKQVNPLCMDWLHGRKNYVVTIRNKAFALFDAIAS